MCVCCHVVVRLRVLFVLPTQVPSKGHETSRVGRIYQQHCGGFPSGGFRWCTGGYHFYEPTVGHPKDEFEQEIRRNETEEQKGGTDGLSENDRVRYHHALRASYRSDQTLPSSEPEKH